MGNNRIGSESAKKYLQTGQAVLSRPIILVGSFLFVTVVLLATIFFFQQYKHAQMLLAKPEAAVKKSDSAVIKAPKSPEIAASKSSSRSSSPTPQETTPTTAEKVSLAIYNGTKIKGLAARGETDIEKKFDQVSVVQKDNAEGDYEASVVIVIDSKQKAIAEKIATFVGGKVVSLPKEETAPSEAKILIILGTEYDSSHPK
ncbi:MAG: LytR C-terminal domain-containing protein [Candidatus Levybacteria bacterium]|nr:LytR C-terminal domain-containing protein [Candidatus Levybacteria bacterium]